MKFSQRNGWKPEINKFQTDGIDVALRNGIWNTIKIHILEKLNSTFINTSGSPFQDFAIHLWSDFYKLTVDEIPKNDVVIIQLIKEYYFDLEWFEVYDFIEYLQVVLSNKIPLGIFNEEINKILKREFAGYRLLNGQIIPITNPLEIEEFNTSLRETIQFTSLNGANIHLTNALDKLSDRKKPDFRNSIKESISAVETTCRVLTRQNTLGAALNELEQKGIEIDTQLKSGFDKIYAFTNNKNSGIRHAIIDEHKVPDFNDAKYMLIVSSSFINFLIGKCQSKNIKIE